MKYDLSILIPSRNEMFLAKTIENILENIEGNTEIIVVLDGAWSDPPIVDNPRLTILHYEESVGQRAATNAACHLSKAKWVMKCDAHCAFDKGFDVKMMEAMKGHDDWTMVPVMKNLHAFDWVCGKCGNRWYQGPSPKNCFKDYEAKVKNDQCDNVTDFKRDMAWRGKRSPNSTSYCFDSTPHFQYFKEFEKRPEFRKDFPLGITETMSLQGSCFMLTRDKYWELDICDEKFGSWGSQGIEVACKTWLSGGRVVCNHKTWYAHMFRTQGGDFGFPYPLPGNQVKKARDLSKSYFISGNWKPQIHPLSWLLKKFWPVPGWDYVPSEDSLSMFKDEKNKRNGEVKVTPVQSVGPEISGSLPTKGIIFYTDNLPNHKIAHAVQKKLRDIGLPIVSASLKPMTFGKNIYVPLKRGYLTMFKQILAAIEASETDVIYFCEHDVLYHPSHFEFTPKDKDKFYYNENVWKLNTANGHAIHYDCKQTSGICVYRELALAHYRKRLAVLEEKYKQLNEEEFNRYIRAVGFEPGTHNRAERIDDLTSESFFSKLPNVDIRHGLNLTASRWSKDQFRSQRNCQNWMESDEIPGWGKMDDYLKM